MWLEIKFWIWSLLPFSFISCFQLSKYIWLWSFTDGEAHLLLMDFLKTKKKNAAKYWKCFPKSGTDNGRILYVTDLIHGSVFLIKHLGLIFLNKIGRKSAGYFCTYCLLCERLCPIVSKITELIEVFMRQWITKFHSISRPPLWWQLRCQKRLKLGCELLFWMGALWDNAWKVQNCKNTFSSLIRDLELTTLTFFVHYLTPPNNQLLAILQMFMGNNP